MSGHQKLSLDEIRARLQGSQGSEYWRSLEELADTDEFREFLHREFPREAAVWDESLGRRQFLMLMGASLALAGLNACTKQPAEKIIPYVTSPEPLVPGKSLEFATAFVKDGYAMGILATSHMGRPTKIEGNPDHPASLGATDVFAQASVLSLYDPDRSQVPIKQGIIATRERFLHELTSALRVQEQSGGSGMCILTETVTSPTLGSQLQEVLTRYPRARWHQYEPVNHDSMREATRLVFGAPLQVRYHVDRASVLLSLDSDFLTNGPGAVRHAREFAQGRRTTGGGRTMNRLYAIESSPSNVGAVADHRLAVRPGEVEILARMISRGIGLSLEGPDTVHASWVSAVAEDLRRHRGSSLIVAGTYQPPSVHAIALAMNEQLGNLGSTVTVSDPVEVQPVNQGDSMRMLAEEMRAGRVGLLLVLGSNPAYHAPSDVGFANALDSVPLSIHLGLHDDETAERCTWHLPQAHFLETWSDARAVDGTTTILQPLISPLYRGVWSGHELLEEILGRTGRKSYDVVREYWRSRVKGDFEAFWQKSLHDGIISGSALPARSVRVRIPASLRQFRGPVEEPKSIELLFRPDPGVWDGRYANNGWLQELPKPLTTLTWENAAFLSPATADALGLGNGEVVTISSNGRSVEGPVWIQPGHPENSCSLHLGYGRSRGGRVGSKRGFNAYELRTSDSPWWVSSAVIRTTGRTVQLAVTQQHHSMEGRHLVRSATLGEFLENPGFAKALGDTPPPSRNLHPPYEYDGYAWGMSIDLSACTGCNACVIACQSENNIPIVGKDQVLAGREMHWIRVDRYYKGPADDPQTFFQPVTCMHCEQAPCEVVCPVAATVHDSEGLNVMVYNRCIGTRYCSNNCPYKVRRFNFLEYSDYDPTAAMQKNPEVTVRSRGVMEKCSYCVQRISAARIEAKKDGRSIRDGEVVTACQAACPSQAIVFGDIRDGESQVAKLKAEPHEYSLLSELNTKPRTTYLANIRNPNTELEGDSGEGHNNGI